MRLKIFQDRFYPILPNSCSVGEYAQAGRDFARLKFDGNSVEHDSMGFEGGQQQQPSPKR